ncbi:MAG: hypothetical protein HC930_08480 [Hydrococcus sp. SU_1_0]|nr:hypothetical protein [Hydrococcus sp. SU_1_0]
MNPLDYIPDTVINEPWCLWLTKEKTILYIKDTATFLVENGQEITIIPVSRVGEAELRFYLVGTVMSILLYQRGLLVLHASAVNINNHAVAFLGISGEGKSSTAAAFLTHGYNLITDDVAPVSFEQKPLTIIPSFPQIKLGQKTADILGYNFESLYFINPSNEKRGYRPRQGFDFAPLPIKRIYVLNTASEFSIEPIRPSEAVTEMYRHSRPTTLYHFGGESHFFQCVNLAKEYTIYRLNRPRNLELLPKLLEMVEADIASILQTTTV